MMFGKVNRVSAHRKRNALIVAPLISVMSLPLQATEKLEHDLQEPQTFHLRNTALIVQGDTQTSIEGTNGDDMQIIVDHNAQDEQWGFSVGAKVSSIGGGASVSAKWGEKVGADQTTQLNNIGRSTNTGNLQNITDESRDTRGVLNLGVQTGSNWVAVRLNPVDAVILLDSAGLQSINSAANRLGYVSQTLEGFGVNIGDVGRGLRGVHAASNNLQQTSEAHNSVASSVIE